MKKQKTNIEIQGELSKAISKFNNPLNESEIFTQEDIKTNFKDKNLNLIDPACICLISAKTDLSKEVLRFFVQKEDYKEKDLNEFNYSDNSGITTTALSIEYMIKIINLLKIDDDKVLISTKKDYPIKLENKHFIVILAPRIMEDD